MNDAAKTHAAWLAQVQEDALEPELPICDAHQNVRTLIVVQAITRFVTQNGITCTSRNVSTYKAPSRSTYSSAFFRIDVKWWLIASRSK